MKETYIIYDNMAGGFFESYLACDPEGDVFTSLDINDAKQFATPEEAQDFVDAHFVDAVVLRWL